jgi:hypothetical protein
MFGCSASSADDETGSSEDGVHSEPAPAPAPAPAAAPEPAETCGLGWGQDPDSFTGVEGTYGRSGAAPSGDMKTLTLSNVVQAAAHISSEGDATLTNECGSTACPGENVRASLLPSNAAMNPMLLLSANGFSQPNPDLRGYYNVLGLERAASGEITKLCLFRVDAQPAADPFVMKRQ